MVGSSLTQRTVMKCTTNGLPKTDSKLMTLFVSTTSYQFNFKIQMCMLCLSWDHLRFWKKMETFTTKVEVYKCMIYYIFEGKCMIYMSPFMLPFFNICVFISQCFGNGHLYFSIHFLKRLWSQLSTIIHVIQNCNHNRHKNLMLCKNSKT